MECRNICLEIPDLNILFSDSNPFPPMATAIISSITKKIHYIHLYLSTETCYSMICSFKCKIIKLIKTTHLTICMISKCTVGFIQHQALYLVCRTCTAWKVICKYLGCQEKDSFISPLLYPRGWCHWTCKNINWEQIRGNARKSMKKQNVFVYKCVFSCIISKIYTKFIYILFIPA